MRHLPMFLLLGVGGLHGLPGCEQTTAPEGDPEALCSALSCPMAPEGGQPLACPPGELVLCCPTAQGVEKRRFDITGEGRDYAVRTHNGTPHLGVAFVRKGDIGFQSNRSLSLELEPAGRIGFALMGSDACFDTADPFETVAQGGDVSPSSATWRYDREHATFVFVLSEVVRHTPETAAGAADDEPRFGPISGCAGVELDPP